jgi:hypothetical protein
MKRILLTLLFLLGIPAAFAQCPQNAQRVAVNLTGTGDNTIVASDPNRQIRVWQFFMVNTHASTDVNITWKEGSTSTSGAYVLKAGGGAHSEPCSGTPWAIVPVGSAFVLNTSASGSIQGTFYYTYQQP